MFDAASSRENSVEDRYRIHETIWAGYLMAAVEATPALHVTFGRAGRAHDVSATANAFVAPSAASFAGLPFAPGDILPISAAAATRTPRPP